MIKTLQPLLDSQSSTKMDLTPPSRAESFIFAVCCSMLLFRVLFIALEPFDLYFDEAQYWFWAQDLSFGYYSKPPMIAWIIWLVTSIYNDSVFAVRLASPLLHAGTACFIYLTARALFNRNIAAWAGLAYFTIPGVSFSSILMTTDVPMMLFWSSGLYIWIKAQQTQDIHWWIGLGIVMGLGIMSRYTMFFFVVAVAVSPFLQYGRFRIYGCTSSPRYVSYALLIAAVLWLPNLYWNAQNGLVSFLHAGQNTHLDHATLHLDWLLGFLLGQMGAFGPGLFLGLLWWLRHGVPHSEEPFIDNAMGYGILMITGWPVLIFYTVLALVSGSNANWPVAGYVSLMIPMIAWLYQHHRGWLKASITVNVVFAIIFYITALIPSEALKIDPFRQVRGWNQIGMQVSETLERCPDAQILTTSRQLAAELSYYVDPQPREILKFDLDGVVDDHFELRFPWHGDVSRPLLLVATGKQAQPVLKQIREQAAFVEHLESIDALVSKYNLEVYCIGVRKV